MAHSENSRDYICMRALEAAALGLRRVLGHRCRQPVQRAQPGPKLLKAWSRGFACAKAVQVSFCRDGIRGCFVWDSPCCGVAGRVSRVFAIDATHAAVRNDTWVILVYSLSGTRLGQELSKELVTSSENMLRISCAFVHQKRMRGCRGIRT